MMEDLRFKSLNELYLRVYPALEAKHHELEMLGIKSISANNIWDFLKAKKWLTAKSLTLNEVVDDILCLDLDAITNFQIDQKS